jgi:hypothetical protein
VVGHESCILFVNTNHQSYPLAQMVCEDLAQREKTIAIILWLSYAFISYNHRLWLAPATEISNLNDRIDPNILSVQLRIAVNK